MKCAKKSFLFVRLTYTIYVEIDWLINTYAALWLSNLFLFVLYNCCINELYIWFLPWNIKNEYNAKQK